MHLCLIKHLSLSLSLSYLSLPTSELFYLLLKYAGYICIVVSIHKSYLNKRLIISTKATHLTLIATVNSGIEIAMYKILNFYIVIEMHFN